MINLLSEQHKQQLAKEMKLRLVLILGTLVFLWFTIIALSLLAIRIYVAGEIEAQNISIELHEQDEDIDLEGIRELNQDMHAIRSFYEKRVLLSDVVERIAENMPQEVHLTSFVYTPPKFEKKEEKNKIIQAKIALMGIALTTEDLLRFRKNLQENETLENFQFPYSNLVPARNVQFSFQFEIVHPLADK